MCDANIKVNSTGIGESVAILFHVQNEKKRMHIHFQCNLNKISRNKPLESKCGLVIPYLMGNLLMYFMESL